MGTITLQRDGLDEALDALKVGESVEIYATLKITSKTDSEIVADVSNVEKCEDMEDDGEDPEDAAEGPDHESEPGDPAEDAAEGEPHTPMKKMGKPGKGLGVLIMIGGKGKK